jgi:hypothetical protein
MAHNDIAPPKQFFRQKRIYQAALRRRRTIHLSSPAIFTALHTATFHKIKRRFAASAGRDQTESDEAATSLKLGLAESDALKSLYGYEITKRLFPVIP